MTHASPHILLADDEPDIIEPLSYALRSEGFEVDAVYNGNDALDAALKRNYDTILLDIMLPGMPGTEVCRRLRLHSIVPIIMLTAKDAEIDRIMGIELGADDYITKPFSNREVVSRIRAILRRQEFERSIRDETEFTVGDIRVDLVTQRVAVRGRELHLTPSELKLLVLFMREPNRVFSRPRITEQLLGEAEVGTSRTADLHVHKLRSKIEDDPDQPQRIVTVRGSGYKLLPSTT